MRRILDTWKQEDTHFRDTEGGRPLPLAHSLAAKVRTIGSYETGLKREGEERPEISATRKGLKGIRTTGFAARRKIAH